MKYAVVTFGCRVNQADSVDIERQLRAAGGRPVPPGEAELVVVNTCSVTATADHGARQTIRRIARTNPAARIVATGCYASRDGAVVAALPGVTDIVDNRDKERLAEGLRLAAERTTAERFGGGEGACGDAIRPGTGGRTGYTLRVQTGCDQTCAYCIIPSTRGAGRSFPLQRVSAELDAVAAAGFQEAAVTGVHLGSYGRDLEPRQGLIDLLRMLDAHPSALLFRLSSLEPMDCGPAGRRPGGPQRAVRAAFPPAAAACQRRRAAADAPAVHQRLLSPAGVGCARAAAGRGDRLGRNRRLPGRDGRRRRRQPGVPARESR